MKFSAISFFRAGLIVLILINSIKSVAQTEINIITDSLIIQLKSTKQDTNRVNLLLDLSFYLASNNPDSCIMLGKQAEQLAKKLDFKNGIAGANRNIGLGYAAQSLFPKAIQHYLLALKTYEKINNKVGMAKVMLSLGGVYSNIKNFEESKIYLSKSLSIFKELNNNVAVSKVLNNLGILHARLLEYPIALNYYQQSLKIKVELNDSNGMESNLSNIGSCFMSIKNYGKAIAYFNEAIALNKTTGNVNFKAIHLSNLGDLFHIIAVENNKDTISKYANGSKETVLQRSKFYLEAALLIYGDIGNINDRYAFYKILSEVNEMLGDNTKALANYKLYIADKDTIYSKENTKKLTQLQMQYEFDKIQHADSLKSIQEIQIHELKYERQKKFSITILVASIILLLLLYLLFKHRNRIAAEKKKSESLLLNILPEDIAQELKQHGKTEAREYEEVTILFTDFVGFTALSEQMTATALVQEINTCFTAFDEIITKYQLEKIKTIGDAYMAVCGLPQKNNKHAYLAVEAALEMNRYIQQRLVSGGKFNIRIGLHTGHVVAGIVGTKKFAYDIWGDAVNTASRIEHHSEPGKVNISAQTYQLIKDYFNVSARGSLKVKNKGEIEMYFVDSKK